MRRMLLGASRLAVGLVASAVFLWFAVRGLNWGDVAANLAGVSLYLILLAVAVFMLASYVRAVRWRLLFAKDDISSARLFIVQNEGIGLNNVLPFRVASELTQLAVLTMRDGIGKATAVATLGMERVIDVVASTLILGVAFFLVPEMQEFSPYVLGAVAASVAAVALVRVLAWSGASVAFIRRISFLAAFTGAVRDLEQQRARLVGSVALSVVYWLMVGVTAWIVAKALDMQMSPVTATLVIMATIFFATVVPAAPSAVGTFEWAVVYVLSFFDVERSEGFGYALVIHAVFFLPPTIIAAIFLPREGVLSLRWMRRPAVLGGWSDTGPAA